MEAIIMLLVQQFWHQFPSKNKQPYFAPYAAATMLSRIPKCTILCYVARDPSDIQLWTWKSEIRTGLTPDMWYHDRTRTRIWWVWLLKFLQREYTSDRVLRNYVKFNQDYLLSCKYDNLFLGITQSFNMMFALRKSFRILPLSLEI